MANLSGLSSVSPAQKAKIDATIYMDPESNYLHTLNAVQKTMPLHSGDTIRFNKYKLPSRFTTPLAESESDIDPQLLSKTFIDAQINYYGTYYLLSERMVNQNVEDVLKVTAGNLNTALRDTEDILTRNTLLTTTSYIDCTKGDNGDYPTQLSGADLSKVVATLVGYKAKPITKQMSGSNKFGTAPVAQAYIGIVHSDLISDLEEIPNFKTIDQYGTNWQPLPAEWGSYSRLRLLQTDQTKKTDSASANGKPVYDNIMMGDGAYSVIRQSSENGKIIGPTPEGALEDKIKYGIKTAFSSALLFDQHVMRVRSTLSL